MCWVVTKAYMLGSGILTRIEPGREHGKWEYQLGWWRQCKGDLKKVESRAILAEAQSLSEAQAMVVRLGQYKA